MLDVTCSGAAPAVCCSAGCVVIKTKLISLAAGGLTRQQSIFFFAREYY